MRLREVILATLVAGCGSVSDNSNNIDAAIDAPDMTAPMILSSHPGKNETKVSVITPISIMFDEALDPATVSATTVTARYAIKMPFFDAAALLKQENVGAVPTGTVSYDAMFHKVVFKAVGPLPYNASIDVTLDGIKDVRGNALPATHLVFETLANYDRYQTSFTSDGSTFHYIDFGTTGGQQTHYTSVSAPGTDGLWFTADDPFSGRFSLTLDAANRVVIGANYSPGTDGLYFTSDDVETGAYVMKYDMTGHLVETAFITAAGTDGVWGTADDVPSYYFQASWQGDHYLGQIRFNNPGLDGQWRTPDDKSTSQFIKYQYDATTGHRTRAITYQPGADQLPGTNDDVISKYEDLTTDSLGRVTRDVIRTAGGNGVWFDVDDGYSSYSKINFDSRGFAVETQGFNAPGSDGIWLTADDQQFSRNATTFNDAGQPTEDSNMLAGSDAMFGTADDIINSLTVTAYDANGARMTQAFIDPGVDGIYKTADDRRPQVTSYDAQN